MDLFWRYWTGFAIITYRFGISVCNSGFVSDWISAFMRACWLSIKEIAADLSVCSGSVCNRGLRETVPGIKLGCLSWLLFAAADAWIKMGICMRDNVLARNNGALYLPLELEVPGD
jgi:hypothetical protein